MPGDALWFEHDERGDIRREPAVDASVELSVGYRVEASVGEVEQRDVGDAEDLSGAEQFLAADLAKPLGHTDGAGFAVGEAQDAHLTTLVRQVGEESAEPERFVVGVRDHRGDGTLGDRQAPT